MVRQPLLAALFHIVVALYLITALVLGTTETLSVQQETATGPRRLSSATIISGSKIRT